MSFSFNKPSESTDVLPIELNMYRSPKVLHSSPNTTMGRYYKSAVESFGGTATEVARDMSVTRSMRALYANGFYSDTAIHSLPLTVNLLSNALIKSIAGKEYSICIASQKFPSNLFVWESYGPHMEAMFRVLMFCSFFFPTVALLVIQPFQEIEIKMKRLQRMTGITSTSYWLTMFTFDLIIHLVSVLIIVFGFYIMDVILDMRLFYKTEMLLMILILLLFGINSLFITYIFSFSNMSKNSFLSGLLYSNLLVVRPG